MYNNPYLNNINQQNNIDRINNEINNLQKLKEQMQQPTPTNLTQNFSITPPHRDTLRYANCIDDVYRENIIGDTAFFSKDMSVVWVKDTRGEIKTYELAEIIPKDERDLKIEYLEAQIKELKKGLKENEYEPTTITDGTITSTNQSKKSTSVSKSARTNKKSE